MYLNLSASSLIIFLYVAVSLASAQRDCSTETDKQNAILFELKNGTIKLVREHFNLENVY